MWVPLLCLCRKPKGSLPTVPPIECWARKPRLWLRETRGQCTRRRMEVECCIHPIGGCCPRERVCTQQGRGAPTPARGEGPEAGRRLSWQCSGTPPEGALSGREAGTLGGNACPPAWGCSRDCGVKTPQKELLTENRVGAVSFSGPGEGGWPNRPRWAGTPVLGPSQARPYPRSLLTRTGA